MTIGPLPRSPYFVLAICTIDGLSALFHLRGLTIGLRPPFRPPSPRKRNSGPPVAQGDLVPVFSRTNGVTLPAAATCPA